MTFTYQGFSKSDPTDLLNPMQNYLNQLSSKEGKSVKIAMSDQESGDSHGVIIYCNDDAPNESTLADSWESQYYDSSTDYDKIYDECCAYMNELTSAQAYYSQVAMTNRKHGSSYIVLWYRNLK